MSSPAFLTSSSEVEKSHHTATSQDSAPRGAESLSSLQHESIISSHQSETRSPDGVNPARVKSLFEPTSHEFKLKLPAFHYNASLHPVDTSPSQAHPTIAAQRTSPLSAELRIQTDLWNAEKKDEGNSSHTAEANALETTRRHTPSSSKLPVRTNSVKSALSAAHYTGGSLSPASAVSSPGLGPLADITPLPSPIAFGGTPGPWPAMAGFPNSTPPRSENGTVVHDNQPDPTSYSRGSPKKRKAYQGLIQAATGSPDREQILAANASSHARNRSLSEYVPGGVQVPRRYNAVSISQHAANAGPPSPKQMQREEYLAVQRGISTAQTPRPPTPPASNRSATGSSDLESPPSSPRPNRGALPLRYEAVDIKTGLTKRWSAIRQLGKGTFSTVMLATSEDQLDADHVPISEAQLNPKSLVAVKICEHGPAGGADEKKIESSLKRELDILKSIDHPSLVQLKAVNITEKRAFLVLNYARGGDLFELASLQNDLLVPSLTRRIFAELVSAVRCLHSQYIVHRDIKLENVLVNLPTSKMHAVSDWQTYPNPVVTLTDLGLGRWIPKPPESPLLNTPCGSEDYAAPELLMGQEYDGRATDAWALGVLLYALMEGRLPFDPIPGSRRQSPMSHRIARCEWSWVRYADKDGDWDARKAPELEGGRECVEGLLKRARSRWGLDVVEQKEWVKGGIAIKGGLKRDPTDDNDGDMANAGSNL
ncbi:hypothetical protein MMC30_000747 [Trapelia coarctata]|nr:hypothetical protein [Trapelia coarctata]